MTRGTQSFLQVTYDGHKRTEAWLHSSPLRSQKTAVPGAPGVWETAAGALTGEEGGAMRGGTEHYHLLLGSHLCCRSLGKTESLMALNQKAHVIFTAVCDMHCRAPVLSFRTQNPQPRCCSRNAVVEPRPGPGGSHFCAGSGERQPYQIPPAPIREMRCCQGTHPGRGLCCT